MKKIIKEKLLAELLEGYKDHIVLRGDEEVGFKQYIVEAAQELLDNDVNRVPVSQARYAFGQPLEVKGSMKVVDGRLVDRETGKDVLLTEQLEGKDVICIIEDHFNKILTQGMYNVCA